MNEKDVIKKYLKGSSCGELAETYNTYPNKILRILRKHSIQIRTKSEAQKMALKNGRSSHPTEGRKASEETRIKQSESQGKRWDNMPEEERERAREYAKERWESLSEIEIADMRSKAGAALRIASQEGSKAEKFLCEKLKESDYTVVPHKVNLIPGNYELDIYLPDYNIVIEIDGPQHFLPIFGEKSLNKHITYDNKKNGLLLQNKIKILRVKYLVKHTSERVNRKLWKVVEEGLNKLKKYKRARILEVEINERNDNG